MLQKRVGQKQGKCNCGGNNKLKKKGNETQKGTMGENLQLTGIYTKLAMRNLYDIEYEKMIYI